MKTVIVLWGGKKIVFKRVDTQINNFGSLIIISGGATEIARFTAPFAVITDIKDIVEVTND